MRTVAKPDLDAALARIEGKFDDVITPLIDNLLVSELNKTTESKRLDPERLHDALRYGEEMRDSGKQALLAALRSKWNRATSLIED